ncbi:hypothetical protein ACEUZ9_000919 [Paracoccus litorisediminis]|uniref:hypothetical protein n=1 Tax=Paracoccus litorisediminis TaxID=2006130 RepID=UPI00372F1526
MHQANSSCSIRIRAVVASLALTIITGPGARADTLNGLRSEGQVVILDAARLQLLAGSPFQCSSELNDAYRKARMPMGDSLATLAEIRRRVVRQFLYLEDRSEAWTNLAPVMLDGGIGMGDCDDFAATIISLALCAGIPKEKLGFAMASSIGEPSIDNIDHALGLYFGEAGTQVIADTNRDRLRPYAAERDGVIFWQDIGSLNDRPGQYHATVQIGSAMAEQNISLKER